MEIRKILTKQKLIHEYIRKLVRKMILLVSILLVVTASSGCSTFGDVAPELRVDYGTDPDKQDSNVRFRTTYYFRIVDSCRVDEGVPAPPPAAAATETNTTMQGEGDPNYALRAVFNARISGKLKIVNDSLYRFRMVRKTSALFNNIHFESGVLRAEQIDPFGTAIIYDDKTRTYRIEPASTIRQSAQRKMILDETEELRKLYRNLKEKDPDLHAQLKDELETMLKNKIEQNFGNGGMATIKINVGDQEQHTNLCPDGRPARRSYLLYGPEGVREVDPDERLLMAMSSDSKPLVSLLQQLSEKHLASRTDQGVEYQSLAEERALIYKLKNHVRVSKEQLQIKQEAVSSKEVLQQLIGEIKKHTRSDRQE